MDNKGPFTPSDVAAWMLSEFNRSQVLFHDVAVWRIREIFGTEFTYLDEEGNIGIAANILSAFRTMTKDTVVWERRKRYWRKRADYDALGRSQDSARREITQRVQEVSELLTAHREQYFCDECIIELTGIKLTDKAIRLIANRYTGRRDPRGRVLFCHRVEAECVNCRQRRMATALTSA